MKKIILIGIVIVLLVTLIVAESAEELKQLFIGNMKEYVKENSEDNDITGEAIDEEINGKRVLEIAINRLKESKD